MSRQSQDARTVHGQVHREVGLDRIFDTVPPLHHSRTMDTPRLRPGPYALLFLVVVGGCGRASGVTNDAGVTVTCFDDPQAGTTTWNPPRKTLPWVAIIGNAGNVDAGNGSNAGVDAAVPPSAGCGAMTAFGGVTCRGLAGATQSGSALDLVWADGSVLRWDSTIVDKAVARPVVANGDSVWVEFSYAVQVVCPFCGTSNSTSVSIRKAEAGVVIWTGQQGHTLGDVSDAQAQELFGVSFREQASCHGKVTLGCWTTDRTLYDHILETTPEQVVPHATIARVTTPKGQYDLFWTHSTDDKATDTCIDGPGLAADTGFAASLIAAP